MSMQAEELVEGCLFFLHLHISFILSLFSRFLQMGLKVALCANSPYVARREKRFWKYSTTVTALVSQWWATNILVLKSSEVQRSSLK